MNITEKLLGDRIRELRNKLDITQEELASKLNLCPRYISLIETNKNIPSLKVIYDLLDILNITPNDLLLETTNLTLDNMLIKSIKKLDKKHKEALLVYINNFVD